MKKIVSFLLIIFLLCGCSNLSENECFLKLDSIFDQYTYSYLQHTNNNTKYYSFYLPSDVHEIEFDDTFHHLVFNDSDFVMNLNVNYILCNRVFDTEPEDPFKFAESFLIYTKNNLDDKTSPYKFSLYHIDDRYYFSLYSNKFTFFGVTDINEIANLVAVLLDINHSGVLEYKLIVDAYYLGSQIEYTHPELELVEKYVPIEGALEDIVIEEQSDNEQNNEQDNANNGE